MWGGGVNTMTAEKRCRGSYISAVVEAGADLGGYLLVEYYLFEGPPSDHAEKRDLVPCENDVRHLTWPTRTPSERTGIHTHTHTDLYHSFKWTETGDPVCYGPSLISVCLTGATGQKHQLFTCNGEDNSYVPTILF